MPDNMQPDGLASASDPSVWWNYMQIRFLLCLCHLVLLFEAWTSREALNPLLRKAVRFVESIRKVWLFKTTRESSGGIKEKYLNELRMKSMSRLFSHVRSAMLLVMAMMVFVMENLQHWGPEPEICIEMFCVLFASLLSRWLSVCTLTQTRIDIFCGSVYVLAFFCMFFLPTQELALFAALSHSCLMLLSVSLMRLHVTCVANLIFALLACWRFKQNPVLNPTFYPNHTVALCFSELVAWVITTLVCALKEQALSELLQSELSSHSAKQAAERLLSGVCDSVVTLGPDLRITQATPQLMHMLCPTKPMDPSELEGTLFSNYLATQSDRDKYSSFVSHIPVFLADHCQSSGGNNVTALHVNLHHALGREISTQLFHVSFQGIDDQWDHLIGITEVRKEGDSPDESLFEGEKTSFMKCAEERQHSEFKTDASCSPESLHQMPILNKVRSRRGDSSPSSRSSKRAVVKYSKRDLGLSSITMNLDVHELEIQEYTFNFGHKRKKPGLVNCLAAGGTDSFMKWLQHSANELIYNSTQQMDYPSTLIFRHPTAACASSKLLLCARSAALSLSSPTDDQEEVFQLKLNDVCQLIKTVTKTKSDFDDLFSLHEEGVQL